MTRRTWNTRAPLRLALVTFVVLAGTIGVWSVQTEISGAVIGSGQVVTSTTTTMVQHPVGGVVAEIHAHNGDRVQAGAMLVRLEDSGLRSRIASLRGELFETLASLARQEAILDDKTTLTLHPMLVEAASQNPEIALLVLRQEKQLRAHFEAVALERNLLREQIAQVREQIRGVEAELSAERRTAEVLREELAQREELASKGLVKFAELYQSRRAMLAVEGKTGSLAARAAELAGKITELELKLHTLLPKRKEDADQQIVRLRPQRAKLIEEHVGLVEKINALEVRAPVTGTIHDAQLAGIRSVVVAAKPILSIIPSEAPVLVVLRVDASDIDQVYLGQEAALQFQAFNRRSTQNILGTVNRISPDAFLDTTKKRSYYEVQVEMTADQLDLLDGQLLVPGMPVEAFLSTQPRTPLTYVTRPLVQYFNRAMRDT